MRDKKLIHVYDIDMSLVAILENAYQIGYELETNNLWKCSFKLPLNDPKNEEVTPKRFIELWDHDKRIGMFVVNPKHTVKNESAREITYNCEHVLSTLHSEVLFGYHQFTNFTTEQVLQALIDEQETKHWRLGTVEFTRYFHYAWEHEDSLLNALFSVPKPFDESYIWTWDDTKYPFTLNLVRPSDVKVDVVRAGKNLKGIEIEVDPTNIINRIYPLGYGEGVNQLTIKEVNGGVEYLEDSESIQKYGLQKKIWVDRRFEDPESLKASAQAFLDKYKEPLKTVAIDLIDYRHLDPYRVTKYDCADILEVFDEDTNTKEELRIMKITKRDIYGNPFDIQLEVGNVRQNIGMTISDLQKKQLVNETYSQGATNLDSYTFNDNADSSFPAIIEFPFPDDMVNVNESILRIKVSKFRAYSKAIKDGGAVVSSSTTSSGGGVVQSVTSSAGGASLQTSSFTNPTFFIYSSTRLPLNDATFENHFHAVEVNDQLDHAHQFQTPDHTHDVDINIQPHTHDVTLNIPSHSHGIEYGIWEYEELPTSLTVKVDGQVVSFNGLDGEIDITDYLRKDTEGKVTRDYHTIEVIPDDLARINLILTNRFFVQSRKGGTY